MNEPYLKVARNPVTAQWIWVIAEEDRAGRTTVLSVGKADTEEAAKKEGRTAMQNREWETRQ